jgi:hypothetical protein
MITIDPDDLAALVERLDHEHFGYNDRGAAALRAFRGLEAAVDNDAALIVLLEQINPGKPQRTKP